MLVKDNLLYTKEHEWVEVVEEGRVKLGLTDYAQDQMGDIVFVELPDEETYDQGDTVSSIESVKAVSEVYMPFNGEVVSVNEELDDEPELLNKDCYGHYIMEIVLENEDDLSELMNSEDYKSYLESL